MDRDTEWVPGLFLYPRRHYETVGQVMERCSDGGEDQGAEEALWGRRRRRIITSVLERAVSRERAALSFSARERDLRPGTFAGQVYVAAVAPSDR